MIVHSIPEAKVGSSSSHVVAMSVVGIGDPISGWRDVIVEKTRTLSSKDNQVVLIHVSRLYAIFQKQGTAHHIVDHISLDQDVVSVMDVDGSVECVMDGTASNIRSYHPAVEMKMDGIAAQSESLTHVSEFDMREARFHFVGVHDRCMKENLRAKLV